MNLWVKKIHPIPEEIYIAIALYVLLSSSVRSREYLACKTVRLHRDVLEYGKIFFLEQSITPSDGGC